MRRLWLLLLLLAACTGSQEPPRPALLALVEEGGVRFLQTQGLPQGQAVEAGFWNLGGIRDAAYDRGRLYLLFGDRLEVYATQGFTKTQVPDPSTALQGTVSLPQGCTGAYLRLGQNRLLIACQEGGQAYLWPLGGGALEPVNLSGLDPSARLALGPGDRLAYLTAQALGHRDPEDPGDAQEKSLPSSLTPKDLVFDPDRGRLWGLGEGDFGRGQLYALQGTSLQGPLSAPENPKGLALLRGQHLVAYGRGFQALDTQGNPKGGLQSPFSTYQAGAVGLDAYLYLVRGTALEVWDLIGPEPRLIRTLGLSAPRLLLYIPVD